MKKEDYSLVKRPTFLISIYQLRNGNPKMFLFFRKNTLGDTVYQPTKKS